MDSDAAAASNPAAPAPDDEKADSASASSADPNSDRLDDEAGAIEPAVTSTPSFGIYGGLSTQLVPFEGPGWRVGTALHFGVGRGVWRAGLGAGFWFPNGVTVERFNRDSGELRASSWAAWAEFGWVASDVLRLEAAGVDWLTSWRANLESVQSGGQVTYTPGAQSRVHMVNLHPVVALVFSEAAAVRAAVLAVVAALAAGAFAVWVRVRDAPREIGALSLGAALCMIIVYHRAYDASVLILPMAWCIQRLLAPAASPRGQLAAAVSLALVLVYAVPGPATLGWLERTGRVPDAIASTWLWNNVALIHHAWLMPVLACTLVWCLAGNRPRRGRVPRLCVIHAQPGRAS